MAQYKDIGLSDVRGKQFVYCTPPSMEAMLYQITTNAGGKVGAVGGTAASDSIQDRFLISSLIMEEAITSAQLEGASTTREVAKKMLEDEREPVDEDERMILNNYLLIKHAEQCCSENLSVDMILEFHRIATSGTTGNGVVPGEFRQANDIFIDDGRGNIAHQPPDFNLLHDRLLALCDFANQDHSGEAGSTFIHPVIKAITLHFMIGYEHPFRDGNGRTARALFYWYMLKSEYNLFKYLSISKVLKERPRDYGLAYLYTETDDNDLTYFIYHQLETIQKAFNELGSYLNQKAKEFEEISAVLERTTWGSTLTFIQKDLIKKAVKEPGRVFTVKEIANSYSISDNTARGHLTKLVEQKLFFCSKDGRAIIYIAPSDLASKLNKR
ncbi:Fic family protein [Pseudomonas sp. TTU2014-080ASC]|uniref:Fic family protein n=1 Tax=Pseudomonas sp. TTU2014-080ASC TaxID=1729724 RepID=UPI0019D3EFEA|nr:Fic family protein [Pseudomonas sp. TTU2014-080ASC]